MYRKQAEGIKKSMEWKTEEVPRRDKLKCNNRFVALKEEWCVKTPRQEMAKNCTQSKNAHKLVDRRLERESVLTPC